MGKGCKPRKGHNIAKFGDAYDNINWGKKEEVVEKDETTLSIDQYKYGVSKLEALAKVHDLGIEDIALILENINEFKSFYEWDNADEFINQYIYNRKYV
jgi:hypothetical protein